MDVEILQLYAFYQDCRRVIELYEKHHKVCSKCSKSMMKDDQQELIQLFQKYTKKDK